jgi:hypothetical protein
VKQRRHRRDAVRGQAIDQPVVEVEPGWVDCAGSGRLDARPREREPVRVDAERGHQGDIFRPPVVVVVGDVAGVAVPDCAGATAEDVPYRLTAAVLGDSAFDLVCGRCHAPGEAGRELRKLGSVHRLMVARLLGAQGGRWGNARGQQGRYGSQQVPR